MVLIGASSSYLILERALIHADGEDSSVKRAVGAGAKEWASFASYVTSVPAAFVSPFISIAIYIGVSILWLVPDRRFERGLHRNASFPPLTPKEKNLGKLARNHDPRRAQGRQDRHRGRRPGVDGQTVMKPNAKKVRRIGDKGEVIGGFAGATADAFTLFERLETQARAV